MNHEHWTRKRSFLIFFLLVIAVQCATLSSAQAGIEFASEIPIRTITIDGNSGDWAGIEPFLTDPQGDSGCGAGTDLQALYLARDSSYVYWRVDTHSGTYDPGTTEYPKYPTICFYQQPGTPYPNGVTSHINLNGTGAGISIRTDNTNWEYQWDDSGTATGAFGTTAEGRIPLFMFDQFTINNILLHYYSGTPNVLCDDVNYNYAPPQAVVLPGANDFTMTLGHVYYSDAAGREINSDFSTDTFRHIFNTGDPTPLPDVLFSSTSVLQRAATEPTVDYHLYSYTPGFPESTLDMETGSCRLGIKDSAITEGGEGIYGINFGEAEHHDLTYEVEFASFQNAFRDQFAREFEIAFSGGQYSVGTSVTGVWFNGTFDGQTYSNALILETEVANHATGESLENEPVVIQNLNPETTSVTLKMQIANNGYSFTAWYSLNGGAWQQLAQWTTPWQITMYTRDYTWDSTIPANQPYIFLSQDRVEGTEGLVAYYPFNGNANDESGNGNNGTANGALPAEGISGDANAAFQFDGVDDDIFIGNSSELIPGANDFTIAAWIKPESWPAWNGLHAILTKHNGTGDTGSWLFEVLKAAETSDQAKLRFYIYGGDSHTSQTEIPLGVWSFVCVKREAGTLTYYFNGQPDGGFTDTTNLGSASHIYISGQGNVGNQRFDGVIDEVRMYNRALSGTEIEGLYDLDVPEPDDEPAGIPGSIIGRVTRSDNDLPIEGVTVAVYSDTCRLSVIGQAVTDSNGYYTVTDVSDGDVYVETLPPSTSYHIGQWWDDGTGVSGLCGVVAKAVTATAEDSVSGIDFSLVEGGKISGTVTDSAGNPLADVFVQPLTTACGYPNYMNSAITDSSGNYVLTGISEGVVFLMTCAQCRNLNYIDERYGTETNDCSEAVGISVTAGQTITGKNFSLTPGGSISGTVMDNDGNSIIFSSYDMRVHAHASDGDPCSWNTVGSTWINADGSFTINGLAEGFYYLSTDPSNSQYIHEWWTGVDSQSSDPDCSSAQSISVIQGTATENKNFRLDLGGSIFGYVTDQDGNPINSLFITAVKGDPCSVQSGVVAGYFSSDSYGYYKIKGLPAGTYYLKTSTEDYVTEWWTGGQPDSSNRDCALAQSITLAPGDTLADMNFQLVPIVPVDLTDGLVAYYPFNGNANDESGNNNHGTVSGALPASDLSGNSGSAYSFDGVDDYIDLGDGAAVEFTENDDFSISVLIKASDLSSGHIIGKWGAYSSGYRLEYSYSAAYPGVPSFSVNRELNGFAPRIYATTDTSGNRWHHIVGTYDGAAKTMKIYVDGALENTGEYTDGDFTTNSGNLYVGAMQGHAPPGDYFSGVIDEIRIYNRVLTEYEVQSLYTAEIPVNTAPNSPAVPGPADSATGVSIAPILSWTGGDPDAGDTVSYDVYFGTDSGQLSVVSEGQTALSSSLSALSYNTTYYWQVVSTDSWGAETAGPVWSFTTCADCDGDGMPDQWEIDNFGDTVAHNSTTDADSDGLTDLEEFNHGTNPNLADTDSDGMPDKWEIEHSLNPNVDDAESDADGDTYSNIAEFNAGTDPNDADSKPGSVSFTEDWEDGIDAAVWKRWGSPQPVAVSGVGRNGGTAVDPDGDANYQSGMTTHQRFPLQAGMRVGAWFNATHGDNPWQNTWLMLTSSDAVDADENNRGTHVAGIWLHNGNSGDGPTVFARMGGVGDTPIAAYDTVWDGTYHYYHFVVNTDGTVSFYIDSQPVHTTTTALDFQAHADVTLSVHGASYSSPMLIDDVTITYGNPGGISEATVKGDIDRDGSVGLGDVIRGLQFLAGIGGSETATTNYIASGVDVNGDSMLGIEEVVYALQVAAGIRLTPENASLSGIWLLGEGEALDSFFVADAYGAITGHSMFNEGTPPGTYQLLTDGSFTLHFNTIDEGGFDVGGSLTSPTAGTFTTLSGTMAKISDPSSCQGTWIGTLTDAVDASVYNVSFSIDANGDVTFFAGFATPVSGKMFGESGKTVGFFKTGEADPYDQVKMIGTLSGNSLSGSYEVDNGSGADGSFTLTRQ